MSNRRGVAMLAALWLVVGITIVALEFSLVGRERREFGLAAADRARESASALGAFSMTRARLEAALRAFPASQTGSVTQLRASDPWLDVDSLYSGDMLVDSMTVKVEAIDLGTKLNINSISEQEIRSLISYTVGDFVEADYLAQAIMDWRDVDDLARARGGERDAYLKADMLRLPTNQNFRDIEELLDVKGMTREVFDVISPYLTTMGSAQVNLNTAPVPVLRVLPGMTDEIVARILAMRSRGQRITSVAQVMPQVNRTMTTITQTAQGQQIERQVQQISNRAGVLTQQLQITMIAQASPAAKPVRLRVMILRGNQNGQPTAEVMQEEWR
jgi:type II secretory pathway component PulK